MVGLLTQFSISEGLPYRCGVGRHPEQRLRRLPAGVHRGAGRVAITPLVFAMGTLATLGNNPFKRVKKA